MAPSQFFDERREWSFWKHEILRRYLPKFAGKIGSKFQLVYYVDGFAGAGNYGGSNPAPGSPLLAARLAADIRRSGKWKYELRCINTEPEDEVFEDLTGATTEFAAPAVLNLKGTFAQHLPRILEEIGASPTLFFLDPFGYRGIEMPTMTRTCRTVSKVQDRTADQFQCA